MENAIKKLTDEMESNQNVGYIQAVGQMLLSYLQSHPAAADKILASGKTIAGSLAEMKKEAEKKKSGGVAVLSDQEGFAVVLKYFDIDGPAAAPAAVRPARLDVDLDDLL